LFGLLDDSTRYRTPARDLVWIRSRCRGVLRPQSEGGHSRSTHRRGACLGVRLLDPHTSRSRADMARLLLRLPV